MMSAAATAVVIVAVVVVTVAVVSAFLAAASAVMVGNFDAGCNKLHLESQGFPASGWFASR